MGSMGKGPWQFAKEALDRFNKAVSLSKNIPPWPKTDAICICCQSRPRGVEGYNAYTSVCEICFRECPVDTSGPANWYGPCENMPPEEGISDAEFEKYRNKLLKKIK